MDVVGVSHAHVAQPTGEADQDGGPHGPPRPLRPLSVGGGRRIREDVRPHPGADPPSASGASLTLLGGFPAAEGVWLVELWTRGPKGEGPPFGPADGRQRSVAGLWKILVVS